MAATGLKINSAFLGDQSTYYAPIVSKRHHNEEGENPWANHFQALAWKCGGTTHPDQTKCRVLGREAQGGVASDSDLCS